MRSSILKNDPALLAALRVSAYDQSRGSAGSDERRVAPFVTISRQAGAGGRSLARQLAERLNIVQPGQLPWTTWDNELVEKVASEHYVPAARVAALEDERPSWLEEVLAGLALGGLGDWPDEFKVYHSVAVTIRALAEMGRVIIVGRGGAFITRDLPGGVHIRLVAPLEYRIDAMARQLSITPAAAAHVVHERDRNREAFYKCHWPNRPLAPESFTATFNTAAVPPEQLVESVLPLLAVGVSRLPSAWLKTPERAVPT